MKIKITYKELSIILGILVAIAVIFSYWLTIHQETTSNASFQIHPTLDLEITKLSKFIRSTLQAVTQIF